MNTFGYGTRMDKVTWKKDAYIILYEMVKKDEPLFKEFKEYYEEKKDSFENELECFDYWMDCIFENETTLVSGIEGLIVELINDQYNDSVFSYEDCCIFVQATLPVDKDDYIPSQKEIRAILAKYLNPLIEEPITVGWYNIYY